MPTTALIVGAAAASTAVSASSQNKATKAANAQGVANRDAAEQAALLSDEAFSDIEGIVEGIGFNRVDVAGLQPQALQMTEDAQSVIREQLLLNREQAIGKQNLGEFESLKSRLFKESEFQFDGDLNRQIDNSALSRANGSGVVGLSERIATDQRFQFGSVSRGQLTNLLNYETQFTAAPINPLGTLQQLADFEFRQNQFATQMELSKAGILVGGITGNLNNQTDVLSALANNNKSAIGYQNQANSQAVLAQGISTVGNTAAWAYGSLATNKIQEQQIANQTRQTDAYVDSLRSAGSNLSLTPAPSTQSSGGSASTSSILNLRY